MLEDVTSNAANFGVLFNYTQDTLFKSYDTFCEQNEELKSGVFLKSSSPFLLENPTLYIAASHALINVPAYLPQCQKNSRDSTSPQDTLRAYINDASRPNLFLRFGSRCSQRYPFVQSIQDEVREIFLRGVCISVFDKLNVIVGNE